MWEQDSNLDMHVIVKTEPEDKEAEDSNDDNTSFVINNEDNCYNSSVIKSEPKSDDDTEIDNGSANFVVAMRTNEENPSSDYNNSLIKMEPTNKEGGDDCKHDYARSAVNNDDSGTEDCNYGNMYQIKIEPNSNEDEDDFYGNMRLIKIEPNEDEEMPRNSMKIGSLFKKSKASRKSNSNKRMLSTLDQVPGMESVTDNQNDQLCNRFDTETNEKRQKSKNRRKRKETVRRLKVQNSDHSSNDDNNDFLDDHDIPLLLEVETEEKDEINIDRYECHGCRGIFKNYTKFQTHQKKCLEKKKGPNSRRKRVDHQCEVCGKLFRDKRGLERHGPVHSGIKPFQCHICERAYTQKGHLQQHLKMHNDGNEIFECDFCYKVSQRRDKYLYHLKYHAKSEDTPYLCNACGSQFQEKAELTMHVTMHRNTELYFIREFKVAPSSEKMQNENVRKNDQDVFLMKKPIYNNLDEDDNLNENKRVKEKEFDSFLYVCALCKKEFSDWICLQEHLCRHTEETFSLKCETCGKTFKIKNDFVKHQEIHAAESAVKCDVCGKYLLSNTDMITHRNIHQVVSSPQRRNFKRSADGELKMVVQLSDQNLEHIGDLTRRTETFSKSECQSESNGLQNQTTKNEDQTDDVDEEEPLYRKVYNEVADNCRLESVSMFNHDFRYVASDRTSQSLQNERISDQMPSCHGDGTSADDISKQNEKFAMETNIKNVLNNTSKKGEFYCNVCSMKFDKIHLLRLHAYFCGNKQEKIKVRMVGKKKEYECPICGKIFSDRRGIERHGPVHSGIKAYECTVCGRSYTQKGHLELHMKKHNDNFFERFECPFCFKIFEKKDRFVKHKETHSSVTPYTCNVCNNSVKSLDDLHSHFKTHSHHNFYYVENKSEIRSLDTTKKRVPDDLKSMTMPLQVFDSDKLQELSSSQLMLKEQEQTLCADGQFIYICQICRKQFQSWEVLLEHIDRHFGLSSQFKCETCDDEFDTIHSLKQHINEHREKFEYAGMCQVCMKYFEADEDLSEHFKIHSRLAQKRSFYIKNPKYRSSVANRN